jgi:recombination protein RecA
MKSPLLKADLESALGRRFGLASQFGGALRTRPAPETLVTGIPAVDALGIPRGAMTEIFGPASSGRSSLLAAVLAGATGRGEVCTLVDASDALDPISAARAGVELGRLLWIRCGGNAEHALLAADWLLQGGGFGVAALDLGDVPPQTARRISLTSWFRLRRAIENTPTALLLLTREPQAKSCASLVLEASRERVAWSGAEVPPGAPSRLLRGTVHRLEVRKPMRSATAGRAVTLEARAG